MRNTLAALGLLVGVVACDVSVQQGGEGESGGAQAQGYTMEVLATEAERVYIVTAPDGQSVAARAREGGGSALLETREAQSLLQEHAEEMTAESAAEDGAQDVVRLALPGFSLDVRSRDGGKGEEAADVSLNIGGGAIGVQASGDGADGRAVVRIAGADAEGARNFITDADDLDPGVQQQMLDALNL